MTTLYEMLYGPKKPKLWFDPEYRDEEEWEETRDATWWNERAREALLHIQPKWLNLDDGVAWECVMRAVEHDAPLWEEWKGSVVPHNRLLTRCNAEMMLIHRGHRYIRSWLGRERAGTLPEPTDPYCEPYEPTPEERRDEARREMEALASGEAWNGRLTHRQWTMVRVELTLRDLPPEYRETVKLLADGLALRDVDRALGVRNGTSAERLDEVRRRLRDQGVGPG